MPFIYPFYRSVQYIKFLSGSPGEDASDYDVKDEKITTLKIEIFDDDDETPASKIPIKHLHIDKIFNEVANLETKTCTVCNVAFETRTCLKKHVKEIHNVTKSRFRRKNTEIVAEFFCDICGKGYTRKHDMEKHRKKAHCEEDAKLQDKPETRRKANLEILRNCKMRDDTGRVSYKCDFCERIFAQSYNLMRHRTIHTGVRAFFCHICGKSFRISNGLTRHINEFHYGVRKYSCEICNKTFTARASKDEHMNIHTNNRPFACDVCGKRFKQKASLHTHKIFHTDIFNFECITCGKKFRRASELKVHNYLHTGHRPHSCSKCKASFRLKQDLKRHLKIHDRLDECICTDCGSTFSQQRYLNLHKKIHKETIDPLVI